MGEGFYLVDIIVFAMIAGFLVYRLRAVLGRRHGEERQRPNPFVIDSGDKTASDNVIQMIDRSRPIDSGEAVDEPYSLAAGLAQISAADTTFEEKRFVQGVRAAFDMIVMAYAHGDTSALRSLLSDDVYDSFAAEIRRRIAANQKHETRIERIKDVDILEARMDGRTAVVTVKIISDQMNVTQNADGTILDGDADRLVELTDIWTFSRNTRSKDPNWLLIATGMPN